MIRFRRDGKVIEAREGQSVAGALWAHGDRVLSRSTKYHRPRGLSCGVGKCADCHMRVDGVPNVKTCMVPAREGMVVEGQNAWPSVRHDVFRVNDAVFRRGFDHHRLFVRPRFLYPLFGAVIRRFAGWGRLPSEVEEPAEVEELRPDVVVVGAGPAGLAAAAEAAEAGAHVVLLDENREMGGAAARLVHEVEDPDMPGTTVPMRVLVGRWSAAVRESGVDVRMGAGLSAAYRGLVLLARQGPRLLALRPKALVVATGAYAAEAFFAHNDRPCVLRASAALRLLHEERVQPGERAVVYGSGSDGLRVALELVDAGVEVEAVVEPRASSPGPARLLRELRARAVPLLEGTDIVRVHGLGRVRGVRVRGPSGAKRLVCDHVVVAVGRKTTPEFFQALGARLMYRPALGGAVPVLDDHMMTTVPGLFAAGDTSGVGTVATARWSGRLAGRAAAGFARGRTEDVTALRARLTERDPRLGGPVFVEASS